MANGEAFVSPLPTMMRDRWLDRAEPAPGEGTVYWHVLMRNYPTVVAAARDAQELLSHFSGFHATPHKWLHMTTLLVGSTSEVVEADRARMLQVARRNLETVAPAAVSVSKILYHPEAIMLGVEPVEALQPIHEAVRDAASSVLGHPGSNEQQKSWTPHVTIMYSTAEQVAEPIITALGRTVPVRQATIDAVSLVVQWGPERQWDWEPVATIQLGSGRRPGGTPRGARTAPEHR
jgi:2'-5' RNA ligase